MKKKWLSACKDIWDIFLKKEKEPYNLEVNEIKEVTELYPVKVLVNKEKVEFLSHREFKIEDGLYLKCFSIWRKEQDYALEVLLSENGFLQTFIVTVKKKNDYFIIDISQFSEVLKTEGIQKALVFLGKIIGKEIK